MAYVLAGLTDKKTTLAKWADSLPFYTIVKDKITCPAGAVPAACEALRKAFPDAEARYGDGLRLDWSDRWVQVRASNTEPIIRIIAEAPETKQALALIDQAMRVVADSVAPYLK